MKPAPEPEEEQLYYIKRHYSPSQQRESHRVEGMEGLTLEEAQEYCSRPDTREEDVYFDAFHKE